MWQCICRLCLRESLTSSSTEVEFEHVRSNAFTRIQIIRLRASVWRSVRRYCVKWGVFFQNVWPRRWEKKASEGTEEGTEAFGRRRLSVQTKAKGTAESSPGGCKKGESKGAPGHRWHKEIRQKMMYLRLTTTARLCAQCVFYRDHDFWYY